METVVMAWRAFIPGRGFVRVEHYLIERFVDEADAHGAADALGGQLVAGARGSVYYNASNHRVFSVQRAADDRFELFGTREVDDGPIE